MLYRDHRSIFLSILLLYPFNLFPGDKITGRVVFPDPVNGSTTMTPPPKMPSVPMDISPVSSPSASSGCANIPDVPKGGSSKAGGLLGLVVNLFSGPDSSSVQEVAREAAEKTEKLKLLQANMSDHDLAQFYPEAAAKRMAAKQAHMLANMPANNTPTAFNNIPTAVAAPVVATAVINKVASSVPNVPIPASAYQPGMSLPKGMTSCSPADFDGMGGFGLPSFNPTVSAPELGILKKMPAEPDWSQLVRDNPFKGAGSNGGGGVGTLVAGTGMTASTVATTATTAGTVSTTGFFAGTSIAGMSVAGATLYCAAFVGVGVAAGLGVWATYEFFARPANGVFFAKKPVVNVPNYNNVPNNNTPSSPNPKKPEGPKERRKQPLSKTEAYAKIKDRYEHFDGNKYRLRDGKEPIKTKNGKAIQRVEWDHNHFGEWEAYADKKGEKFLGALDPETLEIYKRGDPFRSSSN